MESLWQDVKYGARMLARSPGFTAVAVLTLALGIGANTAIFSVVNAVLLRPLPFADPDELVLVWESNPGKGWPRFSASPLNFLDWRRQNQVFESIAAFSASGEDLTGLGDAEKIQTADASPGFFETLDAQVALGRSFLPEEEVAGNHHVVVISHGFWQQRLGGDPNVLGRSLNLSGEIYTVVGVTEPSFNFPRGTEVWLPLAFDAENMPNRGAHWLAVVGRLQEGVTLQRARADMETIAARLAQEYPDSNTGWTTNLVPMHEQLVGPVRLPLLILLAAVGLVLLIACANVANLLLARAVARGQETGIRIALGAGRLRLVQQWLTESLLLAVLGGAAGLLLASWGVPAVLAVVPEGLPRGSEISVDATVFRFAFGLSLVTGILFGLVPALKGSRVNLPDSLKEGGRTAGRGQHRLRSLLVVGEIGVAMMLLAGAGLLIRSFYNLIQTDPGISAENVLTARLSLPQGRYPTDVQTALFYNRLLERIGSLPGVEGAGLVHVLPLSGRDWSHAVAIEGQPAVAESQLPSSDYYSVSSGYFDVMRIALLRGRYLSEQDTDKTPRVAVVNETFAKRHFPNEDPLGKRVRIGNGIPETREIVGVVGDVKHHGLDRNPPAQIYEPYLQNPFRGQTLVIRTQSRPVNLVAAVRAEVSQLDTNVPLFSIQSMEQVLSESVAARRFTTFLLTLFALLALALTVVGIYGVISYGVSHRTREIGVHMALGAQPRQIFRLVIGQGLVLALIGVAVGLAGAFAVSHFLSSLLFGVGPTDPLTLVMVSLLLEGVALLACWVPARRATRVEPMVALRYE